MDIFWNFALDKVLKLTFSMLHFTLLVSWKYTKNLLRIYWEGEETGRTH